MASIVHEVSREELLKSIPSLYYEFKDSTVEVNAGTEESFIKNISPLFYDKIIDASSNDEVLSLILSKVPYYYREPSSVISESKLQDTNNPIEVILQDTRDPSVNDVPSPLQNSDFFYSWFAETWGYIYNNLILDTFNKLRYPFINENHYLNTKIFTKLANSSFLKDSLTNESWIQFMDSEEENNQAYDKSYPFYGEEIGCVDYLNGIINEKIKSSYYITDYTNKSSELLNCWGESLYMSGQMNVSELETQKNIFRLQDYRNELFKRKFAGSRTLYSMILESIDRQGGYVTTTTLGNFNNGEDVDSSYRDKRQFKVLNIPGLISNFADFTNKGDLLDTFFVKDNSIPLNTLTPIFFTSNPTLGYSTDEFYKGNNTDTKKYRNTLLRDNSTILDWNNLKSVILTEGINNVYSTLDSKNKLLRPDVEVPWVQLDDTYVGEDSFEYFNYLDYSVPKINSDFFPLGVADINADRVLYHRNSIQVATKQDYPYVTYPLAGNNSLSLMDTSWLNYVESEMYYKSRVQEKFEVGVQLSTLLKVERDYKSPTTFSNFFAISYTDKDYKSSKENLDNLEIREYFEGATYALLWYCTVTYTTTDFRVTDFNRKLISKIKLKTSESSIPSKYKDEGELLSEYKDYTLYNLGILPNTYPKAYNNSVWFNDIGFTTSLSYFIDDVAYYILEDGEYLKSTERVPDEDKVYYNKIGDKYEVAMEFSDDTEELGYTHAMFVFSNRDNIQASEVNGVNIYTEDGLVNLSLVNDYRGISLTPSKETKTVFYTIFRKNTSGEEITYWSDAIRVVSLSKAMFKAGENFYPDWQGLEYHLNPYLNYTKESASTLRTFPVKSVNSLSDVGASISASLCNLNRTRGRIVLCNDTNDTDVSKNRLGYFFDRVKVSTEALSPIDMTSEYTVVNGDNRTSLATEIDKKYDREVVFEIVNSSFFSNPEGNKEDIANILPIPTQEGITLYNVILYKDDDRAEFITTYFLVNKDHLGNISKESVSYDTIISDRYQAYKDSNGVYCINVSSSKYAKKQEYLSSNRIVPFHDTPSDVLDKWSWNFAPISLEDVYTKTICVNFGFDSVIFKDKEDSANKYNTILVTKETSDDGEYFVLKSYDSYSGADKNPIEHTMNILNDENLSLDITPRGTVKFSVGDYSLESDVVLDFNGEIIDNTYEGISNQIFRTSCSCKVSDNKLKLNLILNSNIYTKEFEFNSDIKLASSINLFSRVKENRVVDCFYGNIYDLRLYNFYREGKDLYILNSGMLRELYSYAPSTYKLAHSIYTDLAFLKKVNIDTESDETYVPAIDTIRIFNRGVWDSIFVDNFPVSAEEMNVSSDFYIQDRAYYDNKEDKDIYTKVGDKYFLEDCIEQELREGAEVYKGIVPAGASGNNVNIIYNDYSNLIELTGVNRVEIINSLLNPVYYDREDLTSSKQLTFYFEDNSNCVIQYDDYLKSEYNRYIVIPNKIESGDDSFEYSADLDFNLYMYPESSISRWLTRGSNVVLNYYKENNIFTAELVDPSVRSSEKNNVTLPLVIPPQENLENNKLYLDRFNVKDAVFSHNLVNFLNAKSYYSELLIPCIVETRDTVYSLSKGIRIIQVQNDVPLQGVTYYRLKNIIELQNSDPKPCYRQEDLDGLYRKIDESKDDSDISNYEKVGDTVERGVHYYHYNMSKGTYTKFPIDGSPLYNGDYTEDSLYFVSENGYYIPHNDNTFDKYAKYYHNNTPSGIEYYERIETPYNASDNYYTQSTELIYNKDNKNTIYVFEDNSYKPFLEEYFTKGVTYYLDSQGTESFTFNSNEPYFRKVIIGNRIFYDTMSILNTSEDIYSNVYTKVKEGSVLQSGVVYFEKDETTGEYNPAKGTYFEEGSLYFEERLGNRGLYELNEDGSYSEITVNFYTDWTRGLASEDIKPIYERNEVINQNYVNKFEALRTLKEGTYYFTVKYPIQIIPFKDEEIDFSVRNFTTYYLSSRFKVEVKGTPVPYIDKDYAIEGFPEKYYHNNLQATLESESSLISPKDNYHFPHRNIAIDLYVLDTETGIAGLLDDKSQEQYSFKWKKLGSNHPTENETANGIITLDSEKVSGNFVISKSFPMFLSRNYTAPFFVAGLDKASSSFNPLSADDDLFDPIRISTNGENLTSDSESDMNKQVLLHDKAYKIIFDYTAKVSEISYTDEYYGEVLTDLEKVNYSRLSNLLDTNTLANSDFLYTTDGYSFDKSISILDNSGYCTTEGDWEDCATIQKNKVRYRYFGNPYSKLSSKNDVLYHKNDTSRTSNGISAIDSRVNINNTYTFPYVVDNPYSNTIISGYPSTIYAISSQNGDSRSMEIDIPLIMSKHHDTMYNGILSVIRSLSSNASGIFTGISSLEPNFVSSNSNYSVNDCVVLEKDNYELLGYYSSMRSMPVGNRNITLKRRNLYSNNLLLSDSYNINSIWNITGGYGEFETLPSYTKDVFHIVSSNGSNEVSLSYIYGEGGIVYTSQFEVALVARGNNLNIKAELLVNKIRVDDNFAGGKEYLGEVKLEPKESLGNGWYIYSAETSYDKVVADSVTFHIRRNDNSQVNDYIAKSFVRKCNVVSHKLGLSDALNEVILSSSLSKIVLNSSNAVVVKMKDSDNYYPLQFNNDVITSLSSNDKVVYRPLAGISNVSEFISKYTDTKASDNDSRIKRLITPWRRRLYLTYQGGECSYEVHRYGLVPDYLGIYNLEEVFENTTDIINTSLKDPRENSLMKITVTKNESSGNYNILLNSIPLVLNDNNEFKAYNCNLRLNKRNGEVDYNTMYLSNEKFSVLFNTFDARKYKIGIDYPVVVTNIQLLGSKNNEKRIIYEMEYLPVIYSELKNHLSLNALFYAQ